MDYDNEILIIYMRLFDYFRKDIERIITDKNLKFNFDTTTLLVFFINFREDTEKYKYAKIPE